MAVTAAVFGVLGSVSSYSAQKKQQKAQKFAAKKQQRIADIRARRERMQLTKARRAAIAQEQNRAAGSGVSTSTSSGAIGSITSQTTSSLATGNQVGALNREISNRNISASNSAQQYTNIFAATQIGQDIFEAKKTTDSIFKNS